MMMPILCYLGLAVAKAPLPLVIAGAVAASMAFVLPIATPPNAIVYGTGYVRMQDMVKNGFFLDCIAPVVWTLILYFLISQISPLVKVLDEDVKSKTYPQRLHLMNDYEDRPRNLY
nr:SLC13 family permease [Desulfobacterales bacterium]